jgi:hypothetical protein
MTSSLEFPTPQNFPDREVLYSDGEIAVSIGTYKGADHKSIGVRWTEAESPIGFPIAHGYGMWLMLPDKLALYILDGIFKDIEEEKKSVLDMDKFTKALIYIRERNRCRG